MASISVRPHFYAGLAVGLALLCHIAVGDVAAEVLQLEETGLPGVHRPNTRPKQVHIGKVAHVKRITAKGKSYRSVGYPKQRRFKGEDAKGLMPSKPPLVDTTGHTAEDQPFPHQPYARQQGKMLAGDVHSIAGTAATQVKRLEKNKLTEDQRKAAKRHQKKRAMKRLIRNAKEKPKGVGLMSGVLLHSLAVSKGRLLTCQKQLVVCASAPKKKPKSAMLGEERHFSTKRVRHTAEQDDEIARKVEDPLAKEKLKDPARLQKHTAVQQYVKFQERYLYMFPGAPGWKFKHDKMNVNSLHKMVADADRLIKFSDKKSKQEDDRDQAKIDQADKKLRRISQDQARSKQMARRAAEPPSTKAVLKKFKATTTKLINCMSKLKPIQKIKKC